MRGYMYEESIRVLYMMSIYSEILALKNAVIV